MRTNAIPTLCKVLDALRAIPTMPSTTKPSTTRTSSSLSTTRRTVPRHHSVNVHGKEIHCTPYSSSEIWRSKRSVARSTTSCRDTALPPKEEASGALGASVERQKRMAPLALSGTDRAASSKGPALVRVASRVVFAGVGAPPRRPFGPCPPAFASDSTLQSKLARALASTRGFARTA